MGQRLFSIAALLFLAPVAWAQAFGRFGYEKFAVLPGFKIDQSGFVVNDPSANRLEFVSSCPDWRPIGIDSKEADVQLSGKNGSPSQAMFNLLGLGFSLFFPSGIDLKVATVGSPYLTWEQGSVANGVATPEVKWIVVSFRSRQPAIVLGFPSGKVSLAVTGKPGAWFIRALDHFKGWVRVALPQGIDPAMANTAGELGRLAITASKCSDLWTSMPPKLLKTSITSDLLSVTADWQFSGPGAVVPPAAMTAYLGGYPLAVQAPTRRLAGWTELGPTDVLTGTSLKIRFPVRRVPTGRCMGIGGNLMQPATVGPFHDVPSVVHLALESLVAERDPFTRRQAEKCIGEYIGQAAYSIEPWTRQQLPFDHNGRGIDLAAAQSLLMQALTSTSQATSESNSLLTSVTWRQDWLTWRTWTPDENLSLRTGDLAAIAGALCPEPERRLAAAMFEGGSSGLRGLNVWRRRQGMIAEEPKQMESLFGIREGLFGLAGDDNDGLAFAKELLSPIRVFSDRAVALRTRSQYDILECAAVAAKPYVITLASAYPIDASALTNIARFKLVSALGITELHFTPAKVGTCDFNLIVPPYGERPPPSVAAPRYEEIER